MDAYVELCTLQTRAGCLIASTHLRDACAGLGLMVKD